MKENESRKWIWQASFWASLVAVITMGFYLLDRYRCSDNSKSLDFTLKKATESLSYNIPSAYIADSIRRELSPMVEAVIACECQFTDSTIFLKTILEDIVWDILDFHEGRLKERKTKAERSVEATTITKFADLEELLCSCSSRPCSERTIEDLNKLRELEP